MHESETRFKGLGIRMVGMTQRGEGNPGMLTISYHKYELVGG